MREIVRILHGIKNASQRENVTFFVVPFHFFEHGFAFQFLSSYFRFIISRIKSLISHCNLRFELLWWRWQELLSNCPVLHGHDAWAKRNLATECVFVCGNNSKSKVVLGTVIRLLNSQDTIFPDALRALQLLLLKIGLEETSCQLLHDVVCVFCYVWIVASAKLCGIAPF